MSNSVHNICVIGSGAWGTALASLLNDNGHSVTLWSYEQETIQTIHETGENPFLKGIKLSQSIKLTCDISCVQTYKLLVLAVPSFAVRTTCKKMAQYVDRDAIIVSVTKGIEAGTGYRMSEIIEQEIPCRTAVLSGPSHAEEVSRGIPTGCVVACKDCKTAELVQDVFLSERFRVYSSPDTVGVELGGALKNVIALCAGIIDGMGFGDNTRALLMTRGLTEIARLGMAFGSRQETFAGLAGVGDLIVTCGSMHSRNRRAGILIGKGMNVQDAMREIGAVVEGYYAARSALELSHRVGVEMPIIEQAYEVLYNAKPVSKALEALMCRQKTAEIEDAGWRTLG